MKNKITKTSLAAFLLCGSTTISLANEGVRLGAGFADSFLEYFFVLLFCSASFWLAKKFFRWVASKSD